MFIVLPRPATASLRGRHSSTLGVTTRVHSMRLAVLVTVLLCAASFAREAPLVFMDDDHPAMKRAFAKAREGLDEFLRLASEKPPELVRFAVKVGINEGKRTEYFWITDFNRSGERFSGKIGNTPQIVKNVKLDQLHEFAREQIVDWLYLDRSRRKMVGNFTYCALLTNEPAAEAEAQRKRFNLDCE
jgi:uncharacterized protein YegJ (DUF2314 family)